VAVPHPSLKAGDGCPECPKGKVYPQKETRPLVRIVGQAPLAATVYNLEQLRCNACGQVFTAPEPEGVGPEKYDETAMAMIAELKYGSGMPFNRVENLEERRGVPLPAATQWEIVAEAAELLQPVQEELIREAAQGELFHNDDFIQSEFEIRYAGRGGNGVSGILTPDKASQTFEEREQLGRWPPLSWGRRVKPGALPKGLQHLAFHLKVGR
jgi:transposase